MGLGADENGLFASFNDNLNTFSTSTTQSLLIQTARKTFITLCQTVDLTALFVGCHKKSQSHE